MLSNPCNPTGQLVEGEEFLACTAPQVVWVEVFAFGVLVSRIPFRRIVINVHCAKYVA